MTVKLIKIRNILGISDIEFEPGKVTEIKGANATGKTSILNAIRALTKVGGEAQLLRDGEEQGEIVLVLDDGTELGRRVTASRTYPFAKQGDMAANHPASFIASLTGEFALNPIEFIHADDKKRVEYLLSCLAGDVDVKKVSKIAGIKKVEEKVDFEDPLRGIDFVRRSLFDQRTGVGRALKESAGMVARLEQSVPEDPLSVETLEAQREENQRAIDRMQREGAKKAEEARDKLRASEEQIDAEIAALQEKLAQLQTAKEGAEAAYDAKLSNLRAEYAEQIAPLRGEIEKINTKIEEAGRVSNTLEMLAEEKKRAEDLEAEQKDLTSRIVALDEYKQSLLDKLPVKDLAVEDGKLTFKGLPFANVNTAEQVRIAFELSRLQAGKLGLVCVDGLELLDKKHYNSLLKLAAKAKVQLIVTAVSDGKLTINT